MSRTGSERGFTLIEVLLTVVILVVGIVGILRAYTTLVNGLEIAKFNIEAVSLLRARLAVIEQKGIEEGMSPGSSGGTFPDAAGWSWALDTTTLVFNIDTKDRKKGLPAGLLDSLNELKLQVINNEARQPRAVSIMTYADNKGAGE